MCHTQAERWAHTRKLGACKNVPSKNVFAHISYTSFQIQTSPGKLLHKRNVMCTQTLKNLREHCSNKSKSNVLRIHSYAWADSISAQWKIAGVSMKGWHSMKEANSPEMPSPTKNEVISSHPFPSEGLSDRQCSCNFFTTVHNVCLVYDSKFRSYGWGRCVSLWSQYLL